MKSFPRQPDLSYFAGFFDGEGTVGIQRQSGAGRTYLLYVCIANTNLEVLELVRARFDGWITDGKTVPPRKPVWYWRADAVKAETMIRELLPYLVVKRERAELALHFRSLYGGANSLPRGVHAHGEGAQEKRAGIISLRERCYLEMRDLNQRGIAA